MNYARMCPFRPSDYTATEKITDLPSPHKRAFEFIRQRLTVESRKIPRRVLLARLNLRTLYLR